MNLVNILGLLGGSFFAYAAVPSAIAVAKAGKNIGVPVNMGWLILSGLTFMFAYLFLTYGFDKIIATNFSIESLSWAAILWYNYFPRRAK